MAYDVKVRFKSFLPGAGYDASGRPVQGKTTVQGVLEGSVVGGGGQPLTAVDLGLQTLDSLHLELEEGSPSNNPASPDTRRVFYSKSSAEFYIATVGDEAIAPLPLANGTTANVMFTAFGDAAHNAELL
jgi:hypothetical protein